jgi:hypothetical protein
MLRKLLYVSIILSGSLLPGIVSAATSLEGDRAVLNGEIIGGVRRYILNGSNKTMLGSGLTVPTDATAGYAKGALFIDTNVATGISGLYINNGTVDSCAFKIVGNNAMRVDSVTAVATTGTTSVYTTVPTSGVVTAIQFASTQGIATSSTNYANFKITNLGQTGSGNNILTNPSTAVTKTTTLGTNTVFTVPLSGTSSELVVVKGDRLKCDVGATGTLDNTLTHPSYLISVSGN